MKGYPLFNTKGQPGLLNESWNTAESAVEAGIDSVTTLAEALDLAAQSAHGMTFFDGRGQQAHEVSYRELRARARETARRLLTLDVKSGDRIAIVAETCPEFATLFFACQYAGLVPVPLPATVSLGGHEHYVEQLSFLLSNSDSKAVFATEEFAPLVREAAQKSPAGFAGTLDEFSSREMPEATAMQPLPQSGPEDFAYIQYTSGSTRVARGALIKQKAILCNLRTIIKHGLKLTPEDRFFSWLPFYHDMGLIGKMLVPVAGRVPVSYLDTRHFAMRPRLWLTLMERTRSTISFGPPFGYELCALRLREGDGRKFDLSNWRVAGVGAEMIRPEALGSFTRAVTGSGFNPGSFTPSYGMAEVGLAVSFSPLGEGARVDYVDRDECVGNRFASAVDPASNSRSVSETPVREFVDCGVPLPEVAVTIRDAQGQDLPDRHIGTIWVKTDSMMSGYLNQPDITAEMLTSDGWFNTGDLGYLVDGRVIITGREKDIIIVHGRNFWPQDLEYIAENQPGIRTGDAMAFPVQNTDGKEQVVLLIQSRERDSGKLEQLKRRVQALIRTEFGFDCNIEMVPMRTLPKTSSGKPSRSKARQNYSELLAAREHMQGNQVLAS